MRYILPAGLARIGGKQIILGEPTLFVTYLYFQFSDKERFIFVYIFIQYRHSFEGQILEKGYIQFGKQIMTQGCRNCRIHKSKTSCTRIERRR